MLFGGGPGLYFDLAGFRFQVPKSWLGVCARRALLRVTPTSAISTAANTADERRFIRHLSWIRSGHMMCTAVRFVKPEQLLFVHSLVTDGSEDSNLQPSARSRRSPL